VQGDIYLKVIQRGLLAVTIVGAFCGSIACSQPPPPAPTGNPPAVKAPAHAGKIGLELDGIGDGSRCMPFVDVAKTLRPFALLGKGDAAPIDVNGWPTADCQTVLFDIRPFPAWNPPIDDPEKFQPDWSGTYKLSFTGQAVIGQVESQNKITNQRYNAATNTTMADIIVPPGSGLLILSFAKTRRTAASPEGSGLTHLRLIRPGYPADTKQVFTTEFLRALRPFAALRYMDVLDSNHNPGYYGDTGHHALEWKDRHLPTDATQQEAGGKYGLAWEYVVQLANETGKDAWINIPIAATDDYVKQLALFLKKGLNPNIKIYIEHSNEVWNYGFPQYIYNKLAAIDEVKRGASPLNNDGNKEEETWTHRRHAKRLHDIAETFKAVFGTQAVMTRIRPIYASWLISPDPHYKDVLKWAEATYGPPKNYFYATAGAAYYNAEKASTSASPEEILAVMRKSSDDNGNFHKQLKAIADSYGLKYTQYEIGPDNGGGKTENVANRIRANRIPGMKALVLYDAEKWFAMGGDMYMYFAAPAGYSRYGCWGLSEDIRQLNTPKWKAIYELTGTSALK
jgi:hypothetical protein